MYSWPQCPTEVHAQLDDLCAGLRGCLGENLLGLYLHGSLALGSFNPLRSDLDLLGLLDQPLQPGQHRSLAQQLLEISRCPAPVEISLLSRSNLTPWRYPTPFNFHYSESWRAHMQECLACAAPIEWQDHDTTDTDLATHITLLLRRGVCLFGPPAATAFSLPPPEDFLASLLEDVLSPEFGLEAAAHSPVNVLLNACRTLAYLREGAILSKLEGGQWGIAHLPATSHPLIQRVLQAYQEESGDPALPKAELGRLVNYLRSQITAG